MQILFEQGWLGVIALALLVLTVFARLAPRMWNGDLFSGTLLAAICAYLALGFFDSTFDAPRLTALFLVLVFAGLARGPRDLSVRKRA